MKRCVFLLSVGFLALSVGCAGGQKKADEKPTGPTVPSYFEEIPSSTLFFAGGTEPVPEEFTRSTLEYLDGAVKASDQPGQRAEFLKAEMGGSFDIDGLAEIGLGPTPRFAIYSYGFTPVMRFSLADATKFQAFVETYAQQYGLDFEERAHDGNKYFLVDEGPNSVIYRFSQTEFVAAVVSDKDHEAFLPYFFGTKKPAQSLAAKNEFGEMVDRYGFERSIGGFVDFLKFAGVAAGNIQIEGDAGQFVENGPMNIDPPNETCGAEFARIAAWTPRFVMGFRKYSGDEVDVAVGAVLDPDLAQELKKARGEMPGYGSTLMAESLVVAGLGIDIGGAISAGSVWAQNVQQQPFQCPDFREINTYAQQIVAMGGQAPPAISGVQGYSALLHSLSIKYNETDGTYYEPSLATALRSMDPQTLMMFASQMAPMLQSLQLKADGEPVVVEQLDNAYPGLVESTALMTEQFIGLAFGPDMSDELVEMLDGQRDDQPPFFMMRARTGETVSSMVADLRAIIDQAEQQKAKRNLTDEDITLARKYVDRVEGMFPDEEQTFEVSMTLEQDAVFLNYADEGPDLDEGWMSAFDAQSREESEALMKVMGFGTRAGYPDARPGPAKIEEVPKGRETEDAPKGPEAEEAEPSEQAPE
ncbi:MAG: hypothetical protein ACQEVA_18180 [Myxococcota bacterium]